MIGNPQEHYPYRNKELSFYFPYKAKVMTGTDPSLPTIVFLPGGPGLPSIGSSSPKVPKQFSVIQTDPRGVGCNELEKKLQPKAESQKELKVLLSPLSSF
jgi:pimeloyl-ACP methyl ester carboxylesterase